MDKNLLYRKSFTQSTIVMTPASMIATKLHFHLRFRQPKPSYGRKKRAARENTKNKRNNTVVNIILMRKKKEFKKLSEVAQKRLEMKDKVMGLDQ